MFRKFAKSKWMPLVGLGLASAALLFPPGGRGTELGYVIGGLAGLAMNAFVLLRRIDE